MARTGFSDNDTSLINRALKGPNLKAVLTLEYRNDPSDSWATVTELDVGRGVDWKKSAKNFAYATLPLTPLVSTYSFQVVNKNGEYSEGSGQPEEDVLRINTQMRISAGYQIDGLETQPSIIYRDVFYLDNPSFSEPGSPLMPLVVCKGRDVWKRAIETKFNIADLTAGVGLTDLIKSMADVAQIPYTADSIADLSAFDDRTLPSGFKRAKTIAAATDLIMQIINQEGQTKYQMFVEYDAGADNNVLFVQPRPTDYAVDFVFDYRDYSSIGAVQRNYDKLLKRLTINSSSEQIDPEESLGTLNVTTAGDHVLSWAFDATEKRYTTERNASSSDVTIVIKDVTPTSITWTITGTTIDIDFEGFGSRWDTTTPTSQAEYINHQNMEENRGFTSKIENQLLNSTAEAKAVAFGFGETFGSPVLEARAVRWPYLNLIPEINDMIMIWSRITFTSNLFPITGIQHHWDENSTPGDFTLFNLDDSGQNFDDINPNGLLYDTGLEQDIGYKYEQRLGPAGTPDQIDNNAYITNHIDAPTSLQTSPADVVFYSLCGSASDFTSPIIGTGWAELSSATFSADGRFGSALSDGKFGIDALLNQVEYADIFPCGNGTLAFSFYMKTLTDSDQPEIFRIQTTGGGSVGEWDFNFYFDSGEIYIYDAAEGSHTNHSGTTGLVIADELDTGSWLRVHILFDGVNDTQVFIGGDLRYSYSHSGQGCFDGTATSQVVSISADSAINHVDDLLIWKVARPIDRFQQVQAFGIPSDVDVPIYRNPAGSATDWAGPIAGKSANSIQTTADPTYPVGLIHNATRFKSGAMWRKSPATILRKTDRGSIGFWTRPNNASFNAISNWLVYWRTGTTGHPELQIRFLPGDVFECTFSRTGVGDYFIGSVTASTYFTLSEWAHVGFTWDKDGIGGGATIFEIYIDDSLVLSGATALDSLDWEDDTISGFGNGEQLPGDYSRADMQGIKIYNISKQDWSDRFDY